MKFSIIFLFLFIFLTGKAQTIELEFPAFAGKTYEFILFQGDNTIKAIEDTIPPNGKVILTIPKEYEPYTGMCRWLLTNTAEGGGLDMAIPGFGFKVKCNSANPTNENIFFEGYDAMFELNRLNSEQMNIVEKFETMDKAMKLYDKNHPLFNSFQKEKENQTIAFNKFQTDLKNNTNYNARFLPIVNIINGIAPILVDNSYEKDRLINKFITEELNFDDLYTSGHWTPIIQTWVQYYVLADKNKDNFVRNFESISQKIQNPKLYTAFISKITALLTEYGKDDYIQAIIPHVVSSNKITSYQEKNLQVYQKALVGSQAPPLIFTESNEAELNNSIIESTTFATDNYKKTLLVFYQSGCGPCKTLMEELQKRYEELNKKGYRIISIASDNNQQFYIESSKDLPWKDKYLELEGQNGLNYKNYAVTGTPTLFLIAKEGIIEKRFSNLNEL